MSRRRRNFHLPLAKCEGRVSLDRKRANRKTASQAANASHNKHRMNARAGFRSDQSELCSCLWLCLCLCLCLVPVPSRPGHGCAVGSCEGDAVLEAYRCTCTIRCQVNRLVARALQPVVGEGRSTIGSWAVVLVEMQTLPGIAEVAQEGESQ